MLTYMNQSTTLYKDLVFTHSFYNGTLDVNAIAKDRILEKNVLYVQVGSMGRGVGSGLDWLVSQVIRVFGGPGTPERQVT